MKTLYDTRGVDTCHYIFVKTHRTCDTKSDPNVTRELWVMMTCRCKICTILEGGVLMAGEGAHVRGQRSTGNLCTCPSVLL